MKIEIWSDFICPFCYIGKRRLEMALDQFPESDNVTLYYKSYELYPSGAGDTCMNMHELLADKYRLTPPKAMEMFEHISAQAEEIGLKYHLDTMQYVNTFDAHRLVQYANKQKKGNALTEALLHAQFSESKNLSDHGILLDISNRVGLEEDKIVDLLGSRKYGQHVRDDEEQAKEIGIEAVPFFVFNEVYGVPGAQTVDVFLDVLNKVHEEETASRDTHFMTHYQTETSFCTGEGCKIKHDNEN